MAGYAIAFAAQAGACCATSPHLQLNYATGRWSVAPSGDTGGPAGALRVEVIINDQLVYEHENGGSGVFSGPTASGDVDDGDLVEATAETTVNGEVVDSKTEMMHYDLSGRGGCSD